MKIKVMEDACIGCGACAAICDEAFDINDEGISVAKVEEVDESIKDEVLDAIESCPTGAIVEE